MKHLHVRISRSTLSASVESQFWLIVLTVWLLGVAFIAWEARDVLNDPSVDPALVTARQTKIQTPLFEDVQTRLEARADAAATAAGVNPARFTAE